MGQTQLIFTLDTPSVWIMIEEPSAPCFANGTLIWLQLRCYTYTVKPMRKHCSGEEKKHDFHKFIFIIICGLYGQDNIIIIIIN